MGGQFQNMHGSAQSEKKGELEVIEQEYLWLVPKYPSSSISDTFY